MQISTADILILLVTLPFVTLSSSEIDRQCNQYLSPSHPPHQIFVCLLTSMSACWFKSSKGNGTASLVLSRVLMDSGLQLDQFYRLTSVVRPHKVASGLRPPVAGGISNSDNDGLHTQRRGRTYKSDTVLCMHLFRSINTNKDGQCVRRWSKRSILLLLLRGDYLTRLTF